MGAHISIAAIRYEIAKAVLKHTKEVAASDIDNDEKRNLMFPISAMRIINDAISKACEDG